MPNNPFHDTPKSTYVKYSTITWTTCPPHLPVCQSPYIIQPEAIRTDQREVDHDHHADL